MVYTFLVGQVSGLVENVHIGMFLDIIYVINVKLCLFTLDIELNLFPTLSVTLTRSQQCQTVLRKKKICSYLIELKLCRIVKYIKQVTNIPLFLTFAHIHRR